MLKSDLIHGKNGIYGSMKVMLRLAKGKEISWRQIVTN